MRKVMNLETGEFVSEWMNTIPPAHVVRYHAAEESNLLMRYLQMIHDNLDEATIQKTFPITMGSRSITCKNFATVL